MYLNDMSLGQRGSFAIVGVAEASRLFFGKDVSNLSLAEAATIAGVIQSPSALSPFNNAGALPRAPQRRPAGDGRRRLRRPRRPPTAPRRSRSSSSSARSKRRRRTSSTSSARRSPTTIPGLTTTTDAGGRRLHDARPAPAAPRAGRGARRPDAASTSCCRAASARARPRRRSSPSTRRPARSSRSSAAAPTTSRSTTARSASRRQPGSVFKPFVYLTAFEQAAADGRTDVTPASIANDEPETFEFDDQVWTPENYEKRVRRADHVPPRARALAQPRRRFTWPRRPATTAWRRCGSGSASATRRKPYPSIALGVFEATPFEIATAYTIFPNGGAIRPLQHILQDHERRQGRHEATRRRPRRDRAAGHDLSSSRT